jgi:hypothetical protein
VTPFLHWAPIFRCGSPPSAMEIVVGRKNPRCDEEKEYDAAKEEANE